MFVCWPPLDILLGCRQLWGRCDMCHLRGGDNPQQSSHTSHICFYFKVYCCGEEKHCVYAFQPAAYFLGYIAYLIVTVFDPIWPVIWFKIIYMLSMATPVSSSIISLAILVRWSCCVTGWDFLAKFSWRRLAIKCGVSLTLLCTLHSHFWCRVL